MCSSLPVPPRPQVFLWSQRGWYLLGASLPVSVLGSESPLWRLGTLLSGGWLPAEGLRSAVLKDCKDGVLLLPSMGLLGSERLAKTMSTYPSWRRSRDPRKPRVGIERGREAPQLQFPNNSDLTLLPWPPKSQLPYSKPLTKELQRVFPPPLVSIPSHFRFPASNSHPQ